MKKPEIIDSLKFPSDNNVTRSLFVLAAVGLIASFIGFFVNEKQFFYSYLTSLIFVTSLTLVCLFFIMVHHVTHYSVGVVFRRIPEAIAKNILFIAVLFLPILFGIHEIFQWTHAGAFTADKAAYKYPYLNVTFFVIRYVLYFSIWGFLAFRLYKNSIKMDETGDWGIQTLLRRTSGPGIFLFAITVPFAAFDWVMSLTPNWYSTIFGVYFFAMSFQACFPLIILIGLYLRKRGILVNTFTKKHFGDLGLLTFAFTIFYAYIAFAQFLLIYYANIPEEVVWFNHRLIGSWEIVSWLLLFGRFVIPFIVLLNKDAKSNLKVLKWISIWILSIHFIELYWIIMPNLHPNGVVISWIDFATLIGLGCLFLGLFFYRFRKANMIPVNDPLLADSLNKH